MRDGRNFVFLLAPLTCLRCPGRQSNFQSDPHVGSPRAWSESVLEGVQLPDAVRVPLPWRALFVEPHGGWLPAFCVFTRKHSVPQRGISLEKSTPKSWWGLFPKHGIIHFPASLYVGSQFLLNHLTLFFDYKITQGWNHSRRVRTRAEIKDKD